jgi:hypothetical protein
LHHFSAGRPALEPRWKVFIELVAQASSLGSANGGMRFAFPAYGPALAQAGKPVPPI